MRQNRTHKDVTSDINFMLTNATVRLNQANCDAPKREARMLLAYILEVSTDALLSRDFTLTPAQEQAFERLVERRLAREPIAQILGSQPFWTLDFFVNSHTLCPRPDSETLIEAILAQIPNSDDKQAPLRILDLGTGSGCLLLTLLHECPKATGLGVDASLDALAVATKNAAALKLENRADFAYGHWAREINEKFDIVISNPPYIESADIEGLMPEVRDFEPMQALDGGADGMDCYHEIIADANRLLKPNGTLALELGAGQEAMVRTIARAHKLTHHSTHKDLLGIERAVLFQAL